MKKKSPRNVDATEVLVQIQAQLAALDQKLEAFIHKSLTDIAGTLAAQKIAAIPRPVPAVSSAPMQSPPQHRRPMFAIVCFQCGKDSELPFKPAPGRPVYCPECFAARKAGGAPKLSSEVKSSVEVQAPVPVKAPAPPVAKAKKKVPAAKKSAVKKAAPKKAAAAKTKKKISRK